MPNTEIIDLADGLLDAVVSAYADASVETLPGRRYVHAGLVAFDCEQLVVTVGPAFRGQPAAPSPIENRPGDLWAIQLGVLLLRCVPTLTDQGTPPSADELNAAGRELSIDARILTIGLTPKLKESPFDVCTLVATGNLDAQGPEGGFGGWLLPIQVTV